MVRSGSEDSGDDVDLDDEEKGEDLCNYQFSLTHGAKILLSATTLRPKLEHRYGVR